jgi:hypothetical protein
MSLTGCFSDQQKQFFQCRLEAIKAYPDDDGIFGRRSEYIQTCMGTAGYQIASREQDGSIVAPWCQSFSRDARRRVG